jgi:amidophosphoribosyltransferase
MPGNGKLALLAVAASKVRILELERSLTELIRSTCEDKFQEECGVVGIWGHPEASNLSYLALYAQQHRGQEGVGIVSVNGTKESFCSHKGSGLVQDIFRDFDFSALPGKAAIGHVRYTTAGGQSLANVQPLLAEVSLGKMALAHNGNLINADQLRAELISDGAIFSSSSDTEVVLHLIARSEPGVAIEQAVVTALSRVRGAYSMVMLFDKTLVAVRDPAGLRPLVLGRLDDAYLIASESCAFDLLGAEYIREIEPGEMLIMADGVSPRSIFPFKETKATPCIFEFVYFARPDSKIFGDNVYAVRKRLGEELAKESPVDADIVVPVPDSGVTAGIGYAQQAGLPLELGLIRNHYVGRTFIEPKQSIRDFGVKIKLNANAEILEGKRIVVVDDSIVRGTTSAKLVAMLRRAGAKEVHMRISAPPTTDPCYYGIDTPDKEQLIASHKSVSEIAAAIGVDSLAYLSHEGLYRATKRERGSMCDACFSGRYPV